MIVLRYKGTGIPTYLHSLGRKYIYTFYFQQFRNSFIYSVGIYSGKKVPGMDDVCILAS